LLLSLAVCGDREGGTAGAADGGILPDDLLGRHLHSVSVSAGTRGVRGSKWLGQAYFLLTLTPSATELLPLDALPGHVLHLCLHPQLWHRPW
jgi:hypothetical protein